MIAVFLANVVATLPRTKSKRPIAAPPLANLMMLRTMPMRLIAAVTKSAHAAMCPALTVWLCASAREPLLSLALTLTISLTVSIT